MIAQKENSNKDFYDIFRAVIDDVIDGILEMYTVYGISAGRKREVLDTVKDVINQQFDYEDWGIYFIGDAQVKACYLILIIFICYWSISNSVQDTEEFVKHYYPIQWNATMEYVRSMHPDVDQFFLENIFFKRRADSTSPYDLIYAPFILLDNGDSCGIASISGRMNWPLFIHKKLISGGELSQRYGRLFEEEIILEFEKNGWMILGKGIKIKEKGKTITDCDMLVYKRGLMLIIQAKAATVGKSSYDDWTMFEIVKQAVEQNEKCISYYEARKDELNQRHNICIEKIQAIVVTANYHLNGVCVGNMPVINFGYLVTVLKGAKIQAISFETGETIGETYILSDDWKIDDFLSLLFYPYDWIIDLPKCKVKHKYKECGRYLLSVPVIEEKSYFKNAKNE